MQQLFFFAEYINHMSKEIIEQAWNNREMLKDATTQIGATQAELRNAHLKYHLETAQILSPDQMKQYADLRGYNSDASASHHRMH